MNGRSIPIPRGKVLGGSSVDQRHVPGARPGADFDHWRQLGLAGWGWDDVLPYFKKHEDYEGGASAVHGAGGELRVESVAHQMAGARCDRAARSRKTGCAGSATSTPATTKASARCHFTQKRGFRWSAARAFLKPGAQAAEPADRDRGAGAAHPVRGQAGDRRRISAGPGEPRVALREARVIVAAGAIGTPQLLMLSGIGPAAHLREHGIDVVLDKPGVGGNLQDHLQFNMHWKVEGSRR